MLEFLILLIAILVLGIKFFTSKTTDKKAETSEEIKGIFGTLFDHGLDQLKLFLVLSVIFIIALFFILR